MLACVILLRANRKARTKPVCLWGVWTHLGIFSVLLWADLSYINGVQCSFGLCEKDLLWVGVKGV